MIRAAVLIGVRSSGTLPKLDAVIPGVRAMERWALNQGMSRERVIVFTDEDGPVEPKPIKQAIKSLVDSAVVERLIVYFAGHGMNNNRNEIWFLSDAPEDTNAAVNVTGSIYLAKGAGIPHIVFFSDACRTAASGIQGQSVTGSEIFPSANEYAEEPGIDIFFATTLGAPSLTIRNAEAAAKYTAIYSEALVDALTGSYTDLIVEDATATTPAERGVIRPWPLKTFLKKEVPVRLGALRTNLGLAQVPDATVNSGDKAWLVRTAYPPVPPVGAGTLRSFEESGSFEIPESITYADAGETLLQVAANPDRAYIVDPLHSLRQSPEIDADVLQRVRDLGSSVAPGKFETGCGFKIRGSRCVDAYAPQYRAELLADGWDPEIPDLRAQGVKEGQLVRIHLPNNPSPVDNVLLTFEEGTCAVLPAIPDFLATVTVEHGDVIDVAYEPSENSHRWYDYQDRVERLRKLRSVIAASSYLGVFRLQGENSEALAREIQVAKGIDPSMAIYAAYAYLNTRQSRRINEMRSILLADLGFEFFDLAMLSGHLKGRKSGHGESPIAPPFPLLSQGWALLNALNAQPMEWLPALRRHLRQSLWSTFEADGATLIRNHLSSTE